jgi:hypothetical protein
MGPGPSTFAISRSGHQPARPVRTASRSRRDDQPRVRLCHGPGLRRTSTPAPTATLVSTVARRQAGTRAVDVDAFVRRGHHEVRPRCRVRDVGAEERGGTIAICTADRPAPFGIHLRPEQAPNVSISANGHEFMLDGQTDNGRTVWLDPLGLGGSARPRSRYRPEMRGGLATPRLRSRHRSAGASPRVRLS